MNLFQMLETIFGTYIPNMQTKVIELSDGTIHEYQTIADGLASINVVYVLQVLMAMWFVNIILTYFIQVPSMFSKKKLM